MPNETLGASFSIDVTKLKAGLAQANRLIRESESEFKAASAGMDDFTKSQEGLEAKIKSLNKIKDIQKEKVKALQRQYDNLLSDGINPTSAQMVKLRTDINNATAAVEKTKNETKNYQKALEEMTAETNDMLTASQKLRDEIGKQEQDLENLKEQYTNVVLEQGKGSKEAKELQSKIKELNSALGNNKSKLKDAEGATEDYDDATEEARDGTSRLDIAVGNLAANIVSSLVSSIGSAISSFGNLAEETQEYREDIGKLETAWESAGKSTELATETYKNFYSVLGEEDRSVEAVNHLAKFVDTEKDLAAWTDICTGVWGTFGDSLPIEGLTEAANETAKTGELTGVLADALNWAGVNEDEFQASLDACNTESERAAEITETLNGLYKDAAENYRENNQSVIDARNATSDYNDALADLGEQMEPVNTAITKVKTELVKEFAPVIKNDVIPIITDFLDELKEDGTITDFSKSISKIAKTVLPPLSSAVKFAAENLETLVGVTWGAVTVYKTFSAAMKVSTAINAAKTAIGGLTAGTKLATIAQTGWNAAMTANPIGAVITAVSLLVGGIALLVSSTEDATEETDYLSDSQRDAVEAAGEATEAYKETKEAADELAEANSAQIDYTQQLWNELQTLADENGKVQDTDKARADFILNELNEALDTEYKMNGNIIESYKDMKSSIEDVIETKKAQILLEAYEESYAEAIKTVAAAEQQRAILAQEGFAIEEELAKKREEAEEARQELLEARSMDERRRIGLHIGKLWEEQQELERQLAEKQQAYKESDETVRQAYANIDSYEQASTLILQGETEKAIEVLEGLGNGYKTAASVAGESKDEQVRILEDQVVQTQIQLELLKTEYEKNEKNMSDIQRQQAENRIRQAEKEAEDAITEYSKLGEGMATGIAKGAEDGQWEITGSLRKIINNALDFAMDFLGINSPSRVFRKQIGLMIPLGIAGGIDEGTDSIVKSIKKQSDEMQDAYDLPNVSERVSSGISSNNNPLNQTSNTVRSVNVYQTNNYSQTHSRYELFKSQQATRAAVKAAIGGY